MEELRLLIASLMLEMEDFGKVIIEFRDKKLQSAYFTPCSQKRTYVKSNISADPYVALNRDDGLSQIRIEFSDKLFARVQFVPAYPEGLDIVFAKMNLQEKNEREIQAVNKKS